MNSTNQQQASAPDTDRSARVIKRALEIMKEGHYGWSWALAKARGEIRD
jgi:hypothetical protein